MGFKVFRARVKMHLQRVKDNSDLGAGIAVQLARTGIYPHFPAL
jgi:hypothetical protein